MRPNAKPEDIDRQIANIVARNNSIDLIIDGISKYFQFNINDEDLKDFAERIKNNVLNDVEQNMSNDTMKNMVKNEETLKNIALSTLKRNLLFKELAKL
jgi:FKBP-type peptidyl-prolyl cis-trans isomerase (trigger factor)